MMKHFALLGENITYSKSPAIHAAVFKHLGIEADYRLISIDKANFDVQIPLVLAFDGFNVTKPYKKRIMQYVDTLADCRFDAVNTVVAQNKKRIAYNTDYHGFKTHIQSIADINNAHTLVLGAGGVAEVVVPALMDLGANVSLYNRTNLTAQNLAERHKCRAVNGTDGHFDVIVNCTSYGLNKGENIGDGVNLSKTTLVYDTIYFETEFLKCAKVAGVKHVVDGLGMLIHQAIKADELFLQQEIQNKTELYNTLLAMLKSAE